MNKKLLALAVVGAFSNVAAMADNSNVTIYGNAAVSIDIVNGTSANTGFDGNTATTFGTTDRERRYRVSSNNSYLGFKGAEDLGNGMSAIWQLEYAVDFARQNQNDVASSDKVYTTGNTGVLSGRNTFVGLASKSWGSVTLGLQDTPLKTSTGKLDFFKDTIADYRSLFTTNAGSLRSENSVQYTSPSFNGFGVKALYSTKNRSGNGEFANPHQYSMSATYENGPIFVVGAYENTKQVIGIDTDVTQKTTRLGAGYNFGAFKVGVAWEKQKADGQTGGTAFNQDRKAWNLGGSYAIDKANTVKAQYTRVSDCSNSGDVTSDKTISGVAAGGTFCSAVGADTSAKQYSVGFDHAMSKRTTVYALYTKVKNDANAKYALGGGATGITPVNSEAGGKADAWSLGMVHKF